MVESSSSLTICRMPARMFVMGAQTDPTGAADEYILRLE